MCGYRLKLLRLMSGLTLRSVAKRIGIKVYQYKAMEDGLAPVDPGVVELLAALYDIPPQRVCKGALPPPIYHGPPLTLEDDLDEAAHLVNLGLATLWRVQMGEDKPWNEIAKRLVDPPLIPPPIPYRKLQIGQTPTFLWLNMPHRFYPSDDIIIRRGGIKRYLKKLNQVVVEPGRWVVRTKRGLSATIRIKPIVVQ